MLLKEENKGDFYAWNSWKIFKEFLKNNEGKIDELVEKVIKIRIGKINVQDFEDYKEECEVNSLLYSLSSFLYNPTNSPDFSPENLVKNLSKSNIRQAKGKKITELLTLSFLVKDKNFGEKVEAELKNKAKIDGFENEEKESEELRGNLTLWQSEKEAMKLFPDSHHELKEGNEEEE